MNKDTFIQSLRDQTNSFQQTMDFIEANFVFTPVEFSVGDQHNELGTNQGSAKIFCVGKALELNEAEVLQCFGDFYREDVLENPEGSDHQNIRNFIKYGWAGVTIDSNALSAK